MVVNPQMSESNSMPPSKRVYVQSESFEAVVGEKRNPEFYNSKYHTINRRLGFRPRTSDMCRSLRRILYLPLLQHLRSPICCRQRNRTRIVTYV